MLSVRGFNDDRNRDLTGAIWALPTGENVLVYRKPYGGGFSLYQQDEWNDRTEAALEADESGQVLRDGQYVFYHNPAWIVPQVSREHAVSD
jgi:hypothetical protein